MRKPLRGVLGDWGNGDGLIDLHELKIWEGGFFFLEDAIDKAGVGYGDFLFGISFGICLNWI